MGVLKSSMGVYKSKKTSPSMSSLGGFTHAEKLMAELPPRPFPLYRRLVLIDVEEGEKGKQTGSIQIHSRLRVSGGPGA
jgi:hypothetical protein